VTTSASGSREGLADFLASHGGPFYELQARLHLLQARSLKVRSRAVIFVAIAWGGPLLLGLPDSISLRDGSYLVDLSAWARFFLAVAAFILAEEQVERGLRTRLDQFTRAPLIAPEAASNAAAAVSTALRERDSSIAEIVALLLAAGVATASFIILKSSDSTSWAVTYAADSNTLTAAGWWSVCVSLPLCYFLLFRGLWRHFVWAMLLRRIAGLDLRLVATHPDGKGGLGFLAEYPNAYMFFVFGMSSLVSAALAKNLIHGSVSIAAFSTVMAGWLAIVIVIFALPLSAFSPPLAKLKQRAMLWLAADATKYHRMVERKQFGRNVVANGGNEIEEGLADPTKLFETTRKLSSVLVSRGAIIPVSAAALIPFAIAAAVWLPVKEVVSVLKKLLLL
jgi:hypothetical protein